MKLELHYYDGKAYTDRKSLAAILGVSKNRIIEYEKPQNFSSPLERVDLSEYIKGKVVYYDLLYAIDWYKRNVDLKYSKAEKIENSYVAQYADDSEITDDTPITVDNMKLVREYEEAKRARIIRQKEAFELRVKKGEYIKIDDKDKSDAILISSILETFKQVEDNLPKEVIGEQKEETIRQKINKYFIKTVSELREKLSKVEVEYED